MDVHKNAPLTPAGREAMVRRVLDAGLTLKAVSEAVGVSPKTVRKWVARFEAEGVAGLHDRSSRSHRLRKPTPQPVVVRIEALRRSADAPTSPFVARLADRLAGTQRRQFKIEESCSECAHIRELHLARPMLGAINDLHD